jgi:hypothetical protein
LFDDVRQATSNSAELRFFLDGGPAIVHFVMRVFAMLAFGFMRGQFHPQSRRNILIGQRARKSVRELESLHFVVGFPGI